jgi:hypothetical protein
VDGDVHHPDVSDRLTALEQPCQITERSPPPTRSR